MCTRVHIVAYTCTHRSLFLLFARAPTTALAAALIRPPVPGGPMTVPGLLRTAVPHVPAVLGAQLAALLALAGPAAVALAPVALRRGVPFALAPTIAGYEGTGPAAALRRSARLVRGAWWRTLGVTGGAWALAAAAAYAAGARLGAPGARLAPALPLTFPQPHVSGG
ncbi:hypothetical protein ACFWUZ_06935 [Streptomyces sp. NPDC058646]|uniref:hypothetical protein n=1 Tax=Streptomyces sp. NPDC058646 TaxID=3346574 RepID=UPI0036663FD0